MYSKILIIGIDGLTFDLLHPWIRNGKLSFFKEILEKSSHGKIRTTIPPYTSPAIPAFYTGKNPGKMNIVHFINPEGALMTLEDVKSLKLWDYLSISNMKCCIVNLPLTCPPPKIHGVFISGPPITCEKYTYPEDLFSKIRLKYLKEEDVFNELISLVHKNEKKYFIDRLTDLTENHIEIFKHIQKSYGPFELSLLYIRETDILQHYLWNDKELMLQYYTYLDETLNELISKIQYKYLFIFSDHGFHRASPYEFYINTWLAKRGYIKVKRLGILASYIYSILPDPLKRVLLKKTIRRKRATINKNSTAIKQILPSSIIDLNETVAIATVPYGIKILDTSSRYHDILNMLYTNLKTLKYQNNMSVLDIVLMKNEVYSGEYLANVPDILILSSRYKIRLGLSNKIFKPRSNIILQGEHDVALYSELIVNGDDIRKGYVIKGATIYDILPTILYMLKLPIPRDIDGKILFDIFEEENYEPVYVDKHFYVKKIYRKRISYIRKFLRELRNNHK